MIAYVRHVLLNEGVEAIAARSCLHCHTKHVHSLVLQNTPGKIIRLFVATPEHDLWMNTPQRVEAGEPMSVGFHTHHCNLTLVRASGYVLNWKVGVSKVPYPIYPTAVSRLQLQCFRYRSKLRGETPGFEPNGYALITESDREWVTPFGTSMGAYELHTIMVNQGKTAAWLVFEGNEDPNYEPLTFSTSDLTKADMCGLYQPMPADQVRPLLAIADLL